MDGNAENKTKMAPEQVQASLEESFHRALALKKRMEENGEWPGIYAKELAVTNSIMTKIYSSSAVAGIVMHFGLRTIMPRQRLLRAGLVGASVFNTFWISGAYWALNGMKDLFALEHSLCAEALCPMALNLHQLKQDEVTTLQDSSSSASSAAWASKWHANAVQLCLERQRKFGRHMSILGTNGLNSNGEGGIPQIGQWPSTSTETNRWEDKQLPWSGGGRAQQGEASLGKPAQQPSNAGAWTDAYDPWLDRNKKR